ncbi:MAG: ATP-dependent Clp protease adaptor ClpS [Bacteroidota bacterium]
MSEKEHLEKIEEEVEVVDDETGHKSFLVLHNDDHHTFDYVIDALIEVCDHDLEQAEQCTFMVHYKGKCDVKKGSKTFLRPMRQGLIDRGLNATIE